MLRIYCCFNDGTEDHRYRILCFEGKKSRERLGRLGLKLGDRVTLFQPAGYGERRLRVYALADGGGVKSTPPYRLTRPCTFFHWAWVSARRRKRQQNGLAAGRLTLRRM
jgi:hypothetical protein